jgi:hypothetical protein
MGTHQHDWLQPVALGLSLGKAGELPTVPTLVSLLSGGAILKLREGAQFDGRIFGRGYENSSVG